MASLKSTILHELTETNRSKSAVARSAWMACVAVSALCGAVYPEILQAATPAEVEAAKLVSQMTDSEKASQMINGAVAIPRLNIPAYDWWNEGLHGVVQGGTATVYPEPIGIAASFDPVLAKTMGDQIATEAREKYAEAQAVGDRGMFKGLTFFTPNINIFRDPRWGRGQETYGEDPYLTAQFGVAVIQGLQGSDPEHPKVLATAKHFAVHSGPEPLRHQFDAKVSKHDLNDTYLPAFRAAVVDGKVASVMCVYNAVNGVPGCANTDLIQGYLRTDWQFKGFVVADCDAVRDISGGHKYVATPADAVAIAVKMGTDLECVTRPDPVSAYTQALASGALPHSAIDQALTRTLSTRFRLGMLGENANPGTPNPSLVDSAEHRQTALQLAREGMVLLKNDGVLPMAAMAKKIAVVGPLADDMKVGLGNYHGNPTHAVTALEGIRAQFPKAQVTYAQGANFPLSGAPVPASAFTTKDGKPGLTLEDFTNAKVEGAPSATSTVALVDRPQSRLDSSARWTGWLTPDEDATYSIGFSGVGGNRLFIDGALVTDDTIPHGPRDIVKDIQLKAGHRYEIRAESAPPFPERTRLVWSKLVSDPIQQAVASAKDADIIVAVVGITSQLEGEEMALEAPGFAGGDRTSLDLPADEQKLLEAMKATGKPVVVVLNSGSALSVNWAKAHANAILQAWYGGEEAGTAIAETLAGVNNPAGRLPVTFYTGTDQLPPFEDYSMKGRTYRYSDAAPLYPFGYGLSYSHFTYDQMKMSAAKVTAGETVKASINVTNTSPTDGDEVVQAYLTFPNVAGAPKLALRGFQRIHLKAGETKPVSFTLDPRSLSYVQSDGDIVVGAGAYSLSIGGGQPNTMAPTVSKAFTITGQKTLPQ